MKLRNFKKILQYKPKVLIVFLAENKIQKDILIDHKQQELKTLFKPEKGEEWKE